MRQETLRLDEIRDWKIWGERKQGTRNHESWGKVRQETSRVGN